MVMSSVIDKLKDKATQLMQIKPDDWIKFVKNKIPLLYNENISMKIMQEFCTLKPSEREVILEFLRTSTFKTILWNIMVNDKTTFSMIEENEKKVPGYVRWLEKQIPSIYNMIEKLQREIIKSDAEKDEDKLGVIYERISKTAFVDACRSYESCIRDGS